MKEPARREADVLLVGGGVASARCARTLRRRGFSGSILLVAEEADAPYNRPPLSKELLRGEVPDALITAEPAGWYERHQVELRPNARITEIDVGSRTASLDSGQDVAFGRCLLATGAVPRRPSMPGAEVALTLRTMADSNQIRERAMAAGAGASAIVLGGGFIGVEVAASLAALGLRVTMLERSAWLWAGQLGEVLSWWAVHRLDDVGVSVRTNATANRLEPDAAWVGDEALPAAVTVAGIGVSPRTELAERAGLSVEDGIVLDTNRSAGHEIYAAGDVARVPHPLAEGAPIRVEHWHAAREGGEAAAMAMLGEQLPPPRAPWVYTEFAGQLIDVLGWAPDRDEELILGDPATNRFAVAYVRGGQVAQLAVANGFVAVETARAFVEAGRTRGELAALIGSASS